MKKLHIGFILILSVLLLGACTQSISLTLETKKDTAMIEDKGIFIGPDAQGTYVPAGKAVCDTATDFDNFDPPTETVLYKDEAKGLSFEVPYNPMWGSVKNNYKINPYDVMSYGVIFGALMPGHPCGWVRSYTLGFVPVKNEADAWKDIKEREEDVRGLQLVKINNIPLWKYESAGLCNYPTFYILGEKHNYVLQPTCGVDAVGEFQFMENVVKSMKIL